MEKNVLNRLAIAFAPASGYTPAVGDYVELGTTAWEVQIAGSKSIKCIGRVSNIDSTHTKSVVVEPKFPRLCQITAKAEIAIGKQLVPNGDGKFVAYDTGTPAHTADMIMGIALETASTDGDVIHALMY